MPYINGDRGQRRRLEEKIDALAKQIHKEAVSIHADSYLTDLAGVLNFCICRLLHKLRPIRMRYAYLCIVTGVLENVKQEYYRRIGAPYEDKKCKENGDVFL